MGGMERGVLIEQSEENQSQSKQFQLIAAEPESLSINADLQS